MLSFTDSIEHVIRPKKGKNNILRMVNELRRLSLGNENFDFRLDLKHK
jgi:hypothetical protein